MHDEMRVKEEVEGMVFDSRGEGKLIGIAAKLISPRPAHLRAEPISDSGRSLSNLRDATGLHPSHIPPPPRKRLSYLPFSTQHLAMNRVLH